MPGFLVADVEFAENPDPRVPCLLLLDTSGSMAGRKIEQLTQGLHALKAEMERDKLAAKRAEVGIVTFDSKVTVVQDFVTINRFTPPSLVPSGQTAMGAGIERALDLIQARKQVYKANGILYYRPWLFMITDGSPTDDVAAAAARLKEASRKREVAFFAIGVEGADMAMLLQVATENEPAMLRGLDFRSMFRWLSQSLAKVSQSTPGQQVALNPPTSWIIS
jgi:uncharacterized protein YegL